eukprot:144417-Rhodomonas_salina.2
MQKNARLQAGLEVTLLAWMQLLDNCERCNRMDHTRIALRDQKCALEPDARCPVHVSADRDWRVSLRIGSGTGRAPEEEADSVKTAEVRFP